MFKNLIVAAALIAGTASSALAVDRWDGTSNDTFTSWNETLEEEAEIATLVNFRNMFIAVRDVQNARPEGKAYWGRPEWRHYYEMRVAALNEFPSLRVSDFFGTHIKEGFYNYRSRFLTKWYGNAWANPFGGEFSNIIEEDIQGAVAEHARQLVNNGFNYGDLREATQWPNYVGNMANDARGVLDRLQSFDADSYDGPAHVAQTVSSLIWYYTNLITVLDFATENSPEEALDHNFGFNSTPDLIFSVFTGNNVLLTDPMEYVTWWSRPLNVVPQALNEYFDDAGL